MPLNHFKFSKLMFSIFNFLIVIINVDLLKNPSIANEVCSSPNKQSAVMMVIQDSKIQKIVFHQ